MDNQTAITQITSLAGQLQNQADALNFALDILTNGYQIDKITNQKAVDDAVAAAIAPLQATIADLQNPLQ